MTVSESRSKNKQLSEIDPASEKLAGASAQERIQWALEQYGERLVMSTSFGAQSAVMLHLVSTVAPGVPIIFIDTGYLFPETYRFAEELNERLKLNLKVYQPQWTAARQEAIHGKLWTQGFEGLEQYNRINKVEPMSRALQELGAEAWLAGLRRSQSSTRGHLQVVMKQKKLTKVHPIIDWSDRDIYNYLTNNNLPYHPLWEQGYVSIGDVHSTNKLEAGMSAEETRFNGLKRECGLHEVSDDSNYQI